MHAESLPFVVVAAVVKSVATNAYRNPDDVTVDTADVDDVDEISSNACATSASMAAAAWTAALTAGSVA
jgi:hypothetical protein